MAEVCALKTDKCHKKPVLLLYLLRFSKYPAAGRAGVHPPAPPATAPAPRRFHTGSAAAASPGQSCPPGQAPCCCAPCRPAPGAAVPAPPAGWMRRSTPAYRRVASPPVLNRYGYSVNIPHLSCSLVLLSAALTTFLCFTIMILNRKNCRSMANISIIFLFWHF